MDFSPLASHRAFVAANIQHLGYPNVIEEIVKTERDVFSAAHGAFGKGEITAHEFTTTQDDYEAHRNKVHAALGELHAEWVKARQPVDGEAFIENLLNPPPPPEPATPVDAETP